MYIIIIVTSFKNAFRSSSLPSSLVAAYKAIWVPGHMIQATALISNTYSTV
jgi:hypothetical protein